MTTKEQERKALAQIRKIVDGLGEGSYIGTAFEGCFEIAESNIENDFGCSMQQRAESAEKTRDYWLERSAELEKANRELQKKLAEKDDSIAGIVEEMKKAKRRALYPSLCETIRSDYEKRIETCRALMARAANMMADVDPRDIAFAAAVKEFKARRAEMEKAGEVITALLRICSDEQ